MIVLYVYGRVDEWLGASLNHGVRALLETVESFDILVQIGQVQAKVLLFALLDAALVVDILKDRYASSVTAEMVRICIATWLPLVFSGQQLS